MYRTIFAGCGTSAAVHALVLVDMGMMLRINRNGPQFAGVDAPVGQTAPAKVCYNVSRLWTFVTSNVDDLYDTTGFPAAANGKSDTFRDDCSVFIDAAPLRRFILWNDLAGNFVKLCKNIVAAPSLNGNFAKDIILPFLNFVVK